MPIKVFIGQMESFIKSSSGFPFATTSRNNYLIKILVLTMRVKIDFHWFYRPTEHSELWWTTPGTEWLEWSSTKWVLVKNLNSTLMVNLLYDVFWMTASRNNCCSRSSFARSSSSAWLYCNILRRTNVLPYTSSRSRQLVVGHRQAVRWSSRI
jgi:hypothetical protein